MLMLINPAIGLLGLLIMLPTIMQYVQQGNITQLLLMMFLIF